MNGVIAALERHFGPKSQRPGPIDGQQFLGDRSEPTAGTRPTDTLSGKIGLEDFAVKLVSPAWVSAASRVLEPTNVSSVFALSTARLPGGGYVAASTHGRVSHLDNAGREVHTFASDDDMPVYSLCAVGDGYVAGTSLADDSSYRLRLWDVRTHACIGEQPAGAHYTDMAYVGGGRIVGSNEQMGSVWLQDLGTGGVRRLPCDADGYKLGRLTVLGEGYVGARVRAASSTPDTLVTWRADRGWQSTTTPIHAHSKAGKLILLDKQRLMVLDDELSRAAVWDITQETWLENPRVPGAIASHRWVDPSVQHHDACRRYDEDRPAGATNPHALSMSVSHLFLEKRPEGVAAWDLNYGTPAWGGTTLAVSPTGPLFGCLYKSLRISL